MLSCIIATEKSRLEGPSNPEYDKLVYLVKHDLGSLEFNVFHAFVSEARKRLEKMIGPAVIESQSLPGFMVTEGGGQLFNRMFSKSSPAYTMDQVLDLFNTIYLTMRTFHIEDSVIQLAITDLMHLVGAQAFNDLILRTKFGGWKRAMQIQYNVTRLEEWCKAHFIEEGAIQLEALTQAAKLLQLKKRTMEDLEVVYDVCWALSPAQINKLIRQSSQAEFEEPIPEQVLNAISARVVDNNAELTMATGESVVAYEPPVAREVPLHIDPYIPVELDLPRLRRIATLVA